MEHIGQMIGTSLIMMQLKKAEKLAIGIIIAIVISIIIGCLCICAIPILLCGGGAAILACLCCKEKNAAPTNITVAPMTPGVQMTYGNSYPQNNFAAVTPVNYPQQQMGYPPQQQQQMNQGMELINIQIPPSALPGSVITVMKSNGQPVNYQVPPTAIPGSTIQVYL